MAVDFKKFGVALDVMLTPFSIGNSWAIFSGTNLVNCNANGFANLGKNTTFKVYHRMQVASLSKTITAVAVMKALEERAPTDFPILSGSPERSEPTMHNTPIYKLLPSSWMLGMNMKAVRIGNLLSHKSGLFLPQAGGGEDFQGSIKKTVAVGSYLDPKTLAEESSAYTYNNINFTLCRELFPGLISPAFLMEHVAEASEASEMEDLLPGGMYVSYTQEKVFFGAPVDIEQPDDAPTVAYHEFMSQASYEHVTSNAIRRCGAEFWRMNPEQYGQFIANLFAGKIVK